MIIMLSETDSALSRVNANSSTTAASSKPALDAELLSRHIAAHAHKRQTHDKARVRRDRADGVADGDIGVALECREHGNKHFRHGRCKAHDRCADDELGYTRGLGRSTLPRQRKGRRPDDAYKADGEQDKNERERASRKVNSHF